MARKTKTSRKGSNEFVLHEGTGNSKLLVSVSAKNEGQKKALRAISENQVTFLYGVPGSGKSHCAVGWGIQEMLKGRYERVIFTRPYVEAGEKLGFLPGNFDAKMGWAVMPLYEVVSDYLSHDAIKELIDEKKIMIYPIAYMRGCTFKNSYVIADEMQNSTRQQMRMILTRIGEGSKIVCTGDVEQSDLIGNSNGLSDAIARLNGVRGLEFVEMTYESCVREKIVSDIDARYKETKAITLDLRKMRDSNVHNNGTSEVGHGSL